MPSFFQSFLLFFSGLLLAESAFRAQGVAEDFASTVPVSVSNANPAVVTCPGPHNFNMQAHVLVSFSERGSDGDTLRADGVTYTFVRRLDNAVPHQVLIDHIRSCRSATQLRL